MNPASHRGRRLASALTSADRRILADLWKDPTLQIYLRDGSASYSGAGVSYIHPLTGSVLAGQSLYSFAIPNFGTIGMTLAMPAFTNLIPAMTTNAGLTSNTLTDLTRVLVEDSSVAATHKATGTAFALTNSTYYRLRSTVRRKSGSAARHASVYAEAGGERAGFVVNLDTGAATAATAGSATSTSVVSTALADGWYMVEASIRDTAWGGNVTPTLGINENGSTVDVTFDGDGASGVEFKGTTLVLDIKTPPGIAEAATRATDSSVWTLPSVLTQNEDLLAVSFQVYADGDMGVATQTWLEGVTTQTRPSIRYASSTTVSAVDYDTADRTSTITRTVSNKRIPFIHRCRRTTTGVRAGFNLTLASSETAGSSFFAQNALRIGRGTPNGRDSYAFSGAIRKINGFTDDQYAALYRAIVSVGTIPLGG